MKSYSKWKPIWLLFLLPLLLLPFLLTGCLGGGETSESTTTDAVVQLEYGAVNKMCNESLSLTILDAQRRPVSTFQGSNATSDDANNDITAASTNDIIIEVDMSLTFNKNTLAQTTDGAEAATLSELLIPGTLMFIQGTDDDGKDYLSSTIVTPDAQDDINSLAINSQWDYDLMNADLPQTSETKQGSVLFRVSSLAKNLELVIISSNNCVSPVEPETVLAGSHTTYLLPLSGDTVSTTSTKAAA